MNEIKALLGVCRACMTEMSPQAPYSQQSLLLDRFTYCTSIQVSKEEDLPSHFCTKCRETIDVCFNFIEQARKVDVTMRNVLFRTQTSVIIHRESVVASAVDQSKARFVTEESRSMDECTNYYEDYTQYSMRDDQDALETFEDNTLNDNQQITYATNDTITDANKERDVVKVRRKTKPTKPIISVENNMKIQATDRNVNECPKCKKMFVSKTWYNKHLAHFHSNKVFSCSSCQKAFTKRHILKQHMVRHSDERPFACHLCVKRFKLRKQLNLHVRMHRQPRIYKCEHCSMSFKLKAVLVTHMKVHNEDKVSLCDLCGAQFSQAGNLAVHMRIHTGQKPFRCTRCNFSFAVRSSLQRHERRHDGTRPYVCATCQKSFADAGSLSRHIRTHTGELPYGCWFCSQAFIDSWKRKSHIMKQHNVAFADLPREKPRRKHSQVIR